MPSPTRYLRRRFPPVYRIGRRAFEAIANRMPPWQLPPVPGPVSRADLMMKPSLTERPPDDLVRYYDGTGRQAAELLAAAVTASGRSVDEVKAVLDLGCGHGRVARHLSATFPSARIVGCDVDARAVAFCRRHLGIEAHDVTPDPRTLPAGPYDVVWMGSVLTHLDEAGFRRMIAEVASRLSDRGVVVFSTHSAAVAKRFDDVSEPAVVEALADAGVAYVPYPHSADGSYGLAFHTSDYILEHTPAAADGAVVKVLHRPDEWSGGHDVWAFGRP